ncbi:Hypothetical predicted protein [Lecanosticta acicola]|uniref:Uncharacterized protein n=1 Tax=Lecanosticta acicola TaxID=111012 RepID=A0AAI8YZM3_9PEZI|nr:Hypothetical predicted protein [Lecanosticta acicola]
MASSSPLASSQHILFQPPKSPASVTTTPSLATATDYFTGSRKRQGPGSLDYNRILPATWTETPSWAQIATPIDGLVSSGFGQNSGLVNDRYHLAGGFDTPSLQATSKLEHLKVNKNEFRRRLRDEDVGGYFDEKHAPISGPLARERNGIARMPCTPDEALQKSWTSFAFGLVGRVFSFGGNIVRGFYAGDGQGYDLNRYPLVGTDLLQQGVGRASTPLPGSWDEGEFLGDFEQDSPDFQYQSPTARPPNKRRQTDKDTWVMVGTPDAEMGTLSPKRKVSSNSVPRSTLTARSPASRASSRRSIAPMPRRAHSHVEANESPTQAQPALLQPSFQPCHSRRASVAPTRSPQGRPGSSGPGSRYMSPEAERHAKRQAKQDKTMTSMSRKMEEMIRQAQEALGTKYSVEGDADMDDEGYVDDEW